MMKKGFFLTLEGGEGTGKSTQLKLLLEKIQTELGIEPLLLREPGGTKLGELVRNLLLDPEYFNGISGLSELMLYEACRAQLVEELVAPALSQSRLVVCDRFYDSSEAYQGYGRGISVEDIRTLNSIVTGGLVPDLTLLYDIEIATGLARATSDGTDRIEAAGPDFHERVRQGFLEIWNREPDRIVKIDGSLPITEVSELTWSTVELRLREVLT